MRPRLNFFLRTGFGVCFVVKINLIGNFNGTTLSGNLYARKNIYLSTTATLMELSYA